jgi:hypothetical protein
MSIRRSAIGLELPACFSSALLQSIYSPVPTGHSTLGSSKLVQTDILRRPIAEVAASAQESGCDPRPESGQILPAEQADPFSR